MNYITNVEENNPDIPGKHTSLIFTVKKLKIQQGNITLSVVQIQMIFEVFISILNSALCTGFVDISNF